MNTLVRYLDGQGVDSSVLDEAVADYMIQLATEGGTEEETWSVLEGCYPELEESPKSRKAFSGIFETLRQSCGPSAGETFDELTQASSRDTPRDETRLPVTSGGSADKGKASGAGCWAVGGRGIESGAVAGLHEADVDFLREMMPNVSDRGLRYVLLRLTKGNRMAAASYLADRCAAGGAKASTLKALEADAEAWEKKELEDGRKAEEASTRAENARMRDKAERDSLKGKIVGRYADEAEGSSFKVVVPSLTEKQKSTRYRDGKVVTTTGAKVVVESAKPEWDGGSRGKVKTKGKRGKGFV